MVAICCITIAAKYNEMEEDVPDLHSLGGIIEQVQCDEMICDAQLLMSVPHMHTALKAVPAPYTHLTLCDPATSTGHSLQCGIGL